MVTHVPGLRFWLDATDVDGDNNRQALDGDAVVRWVDRSGHGAHVSSVAPPVLRLRSGGESAVVGFERRTTLESIGGAFETPAGWSTLAAPLRNARAYAG